MQYDLAVVGAGPAGLMAALTAARDGLKVVLLERRRKIGSVRRYCSQLIRVGTGGFSSRKVPSDRDIRSIFVTFTVDYKHCLIHLHNLGEEVSVPYRGMLVSYCNETWVSPSGYFFNTEPSDNHIYGFQIDKGALLAGLEEECCQSGCTVRSGTSCHNLEEHSGGVSLTVTSEKKTENIKSARVILADGAFSPLVEKLGFNRDRPAGGPRLKFLTYILDRVTSPFAPSRYLQLCAPSLFPGQINLGLWHHQSFHLGIGAPIFTQISLSELLYRVMKDSPFAPWFASSNIIDRLGCTMSLRPALWEPARGRIICCGDNAAFAETAIKGALGCGYRAAKASSAALAGGEDANGRYNRFWQQAFYFHSKQYLALSKEVYPVARVLEDADVDALYQWLQVNNLSGLPGDVLSDNRNRLREAMPAIAAKLIA